MISLIIVSIIFLIGAIHNIIQGDYENATAGIGIFLVMAGIFFFDKHQKKNINAFLMWLLENKEELKNDKHKTLMWNNIPVKYDSYVTQYQFCTSFFIVSFKQSTGFILDDSFNKLPVNFIASIVTVLLGWWGFPWGPIYTIQTIFCNLRGGVKKTIEELITELEKGEQGHAADS